MHVRRCYLLQPARIIYTYVHIYMQGVMSAASTSGILQVGIVIYCIIIPAGCVWSV